MVDSWELKIIEGCYLVVEKYLFVGFFVLNIVILGSKNLEENDLVIIFYLVLDLIILIGLNVSGKSCYLW